MRHGPTPLLYAICSVVLLTAGGAAADDRVPAPVPDPVAADAPRTDAGAGEAAGLIRAMSAALRTLDYEGTFVHLSGDNLTSLAILHSSDGAGELERLSALDGEAREVVRDRSLVTCIWPDSQSVVVSSSKERSALPSIDASLADNVHYRLLLRSDDRVAGIDTHVVEVVPRDALRYGYRFWIDRDRKMLLRSMLLDERQMPLEQVLFTSIRYPDSIPPERFAITGIGPRTSWIRTRLSESLSKATVPAATPLSAPGGIDRVAFELLPAGYREVSESYSPMPGEIGPVSHVMLSDGMAAVSVYVEHGDASALGDGTTGLSRMGAVNAWGHALDNAFVTVVGEVPAATVERIALATRVRPD